HVRTRSSVNGALRSLSAPTSAGFRGDALATPSSTFRAPPLSPAPTSFVTVLAQPPSAVSRYERDSSAEPFPSHWMLEGGRWNTKRVCCSTMTRFPPRNFGSEDGSWSEPLRYVAVPCSRGAAPETLYTTMGDHGGTSTSASSSTVPSRARTRRCFRPGVTN